MKRRLRVWCCMCCVSLFITGCWSKRELNELAVVSGIGIDKQEGQLSVSVQVINPGAIAAKNSGTNASPVTTYTVNAQSLFEAMRKVTTVSPRRMYTSHLRMVVIGEEAARDGIGHLLDFLSRNYLMRTDFFLVVSKHSSASDILRTLTVLESIPSNKMYDSMQAASEAWGTTAKVTLDKLMNDVSTVGRDPVLSAIRVAGNTDIAGSKKNTEQVRGNAILRYDGLGVFHGDKLTGWLDEKTSKGLNYIRGDVKGTVEVIPCPDSEGTVTLKLLSVKSDVKGFVHDMQPAGNVGIKVKADVGEVSCNIDLTKEATIQKLEEEAEAYLKELIEHTIREARGTFHSDFLNVGDVVHRAEPAHWKLWKNDWEQYFQHMELTVQVDVELIGLGTTHNSYEVK